MKHLLLVSAIALAGTSMAQAQGYDRYDRYDRGDRYDRSYRDYDRRDDRSGERAARDIFRSVTGQGRDCRTVTTRRETRGGDIVVSRRRVCD